MSESQRDYYEDHEELMKHLDAADKRIAEQAARIKGLEQERDEAKAACVALRDAMHHFGSYAKVLCVDDHVTPEYLEEYRERFAAFENAWNEGERCGKPILAERDALARRVAGLEGELAATHRCRICGALWIDFGHSWSLASKECGKCCDNVPMGEQIEPIGCTAAIERLRKALADQKASHDSMAVVLCGTPTPQGIAACGKQCLKYSDKAAAALAAKGVGDGK